MTNKDHGIQIQFKRMDSKKRVLMDLLRSLPVEKYNRQPDLNTWSAAQVANHLYLSERLSLMYLKKKLSYPDTIPPFSIKSFWSLFMVNFTLRSPIRVKAPPAINMWGDQEILKPDELDLKWNLVRTEMATLITDHQPGFRTHLVFNHPFGGRMTMRQMLIFFNHHLSHHLRQVRRIVRKLG